MTINIAPGVFDILPEDPQDGWRSSYLWNYVESMIRETAAAYGYREIRTPVFERTELFQRGVGETSDIVSKEMYTFIDKGNRSMSLRPEGTAPAMRAFIEHQMHNSSPYHKLFYIGPMFRYERTQAGRYRQHHQFGAEAIGIAGPEQDAELIDLLYTLYTKLGLKDLTVNLNTIGDTESRLAFRKALQVYLKKYYNELSEDSKMRFEANPLRILDSKDPGDIKITQSAPSILDFLNSESKDHFEGVKRMLDIVKIPYSINNKLVRGLDYYNRTVFEITASELGAQNSIGGGGRYDGLLKTLGGPDLPAIGFGTGIERILQTMLKQQVALPAKNTPLLFFIPLGDEARNTCYRITHELRQNGVPVQMDFSGRKLNKVMQYADQIGAKYVAVVGDNELKTKEVGLKEMASGTVAKAPLFQLGRILQIESQTERLIYLWNELSKPFEDPAEADFFFRKLEDSIKLTETISIQLQNAMKSIQQIIK